MLSEKKVVRRSVAVGLAIVCILLTAGLGGAMAYYVSTHHHTDSDYDSLSSQNTSLYNIVNLANSTVWVNDTTVTQTASNYTSWHFYGSYAGYVLVSVQTSTTNTTYVEVIYSAVYSAYNINYDNTITVGTSGTVAFPVLFAPEVYMTTVGTSRTAAFPILSRFPITDFSFSNGASIPPGTTPENFTGYPNIEIRVGNTNRVSNATETVTITYNY
jgi:hypothetical protein